MIYNHILLLILVLMGFLFSWFGPLDAYRYDNLDPVCKLPKKIGRCKASFPRFYFDTNRWQCEIFFYGGCGGNANNFLTEDDCVTKCEELKINFIGAVD
ncbi:PI-stichotoxin-She2a-like [Anolis carolinensis]|uniref:PI-stichotoxin-She2a-like n=1 Tax=Anolis carolinensis TaxID=28377 RepID=UPI002F2B2B65